MGLPKIRLFCCGDGWLASIRARKEDEELQLVDLDGVWETLFLPVVSHQPTEAGQLKRHARENERRRGGSGERVHMIYGLPLPLSLLSMLPFRY